MVSVAELFWRISRFLAKKGHWVRFRWWFNYRTPSCSRWRESTGTRLPCRVSLLCLVIRNDDTRCTCPVDVFAEKCEGKKKKKKEDGTLTSLSNLRVWPVHGLIGGDRKTMSLKWKISCQLTWCSNVLASTHLTRSPLSNTCIFSSPSPDSKKTYLRNLHLRRMQRMLTLYNWKYKFRQITLHFWMWKVLRTSLDRLALRLTGRRNPRPNELTLRSPS